MQMGNSCSNNVISNNNSNNAYSVGFLEARLCPKHLAGVAWENLAAALRLGDIVTISGIARRICYENTLCRHLGESHYARDISVYQGAD